MAQVSLDDPPLTTEELQSDFFLSPPLPLHCQKATDAPSVAICSDGQVRLQVKNIEIEDFDLQAWATSINTPNGWKQAGDLQLPLPTPFAVYREFFWSEGPSWLACAWGHRPYGDGYLERHAFCLSQIGISMRSISFYDERWLSQGQLDGFYDYDFARWEATILFYAYSL